MEQIRQKIQKYFPILPIIYLLISVFIVRGEVKYVYLTALILVFLTFISLHKSKENNDIKLAKWIIVLAVIGLSSATILSIEKVELLQNPDKLSSCSLSPIVACSPIISSEQASAFGIANSFIGIFAFSAILTAGMTMLAGAKNLAKEWWRTLLAGILFGAMFSIWLIHEGLFSIGKLCLYCMLVWLVSFGLLWLVTAHCVKNRYISFGSTMNKVVSNPAELIVITYVIIFLLIFLRWSDYWINLF